MRKAMWVTHSHAYQQMEVCFPAEEADRVIARMCIPFLYINKRKVVKKNAIWMLEHKKKDEE